MSSRIFSRSSIACGESDASSRVVPQTGHMTSSSTSGRVVWGSCAEGAANGKGGDAQNEGGDEPVCHWRIVRGRGLTQEDSLTAFAGRS